MMPIDRRHFLKATAAGCAAAVMGRPLLGADSVPIRAITHGPKFHWFGYYDKFEFDPTNRYVLSNEVDFEHRTPTANDVIQVGMVDLEDNDRWIELGTSNAWGWQQGCMLQWRPGHGSEVIWNDREGDRFVSRILDIKTRQQRTLPAPVYAVSPDGEFAVTADFARIQRHRPGYGYAGLTDPHADERAPGESGVFFLDLNTGHQKLILSLADAASFPFEGESVREKWHKFNHLLISPDSRRFVVLNRWREHDPETGGPKLSPWKTRMISANVDGSDVSVLDLPGMISHFVWRDPEHLCMWTKPRDQPAGFYVVEARTTRAEPVGAGIMTVDGHNTYLPEHPDWILCDTYPERTTRKQTPYLFHLPTRKRIDLGSFFLDPKYAGEWRCDLHPRASRDGRYVAIDSPHLGNGRQVHLIEIESLLRS